MGKCHGIIFLNQYLFRGHLVIKIVVNSLETAISLVWFKYKSKEVKINDKSGSNEMMSDSGKRQIQTQAKKKS